MGISRGPSGRKEDRKEVLQAEGAGAEALGQA